jgi:membrane associated rhomboid family serine protease
MFGLNPSSDILAHLGGFVSGLFFGGILSLAPEAQLQKRRTNLACFGVLLGIMTLTWALALR